MFLVHIRADTTGDQYDSNICKTELCLLIKSTNIVLTDPIKCFQWAGGRTLRFLMKSYDYDPNLAHLCKDTRISINGLVYFCTQTDANAPKTYTDKPNERY